MFIDGVTYAVIARNLTQGVGSFWFPFYTASVYPQFHEQPPLGFALQAAAFALFGDHLAVERVYSLVMGCLTAVLIVAIWRTTIRDTAHDWLPIVFWLLPSTVTWSIVNNMLENTQTVFTTAAVLVFVYSLRGGRVAWASSVIGGALVLGAVLIKGPNGFFPLAAPVIAAALLRDRARQAARSGAVLLATVIAGAACILWPEGPRTALVTYWHQHVVAAVTGTRGGGRLAAVAALVRHLAGGIFLRMGGTLGLIWLFATLRRTPPVRHNHGVRNWAGFFLALGLAGSAPILLSSKIAGHYLVPSIPLYALGLATLALPLVEPLQNHFGGRRSVVTAVGVVGVVLFLLAGVISLLRIQVEPRDVQWIAEYRILGPSLPVGTTLATCAAVAGDWGLHAYMQRFFRVSLDPQTDQNRRYYLQVTDRACEAPPSCRRIAATARLNLLDCSSSQQGDGR